MDNFIFDIIYVIGSTVDVTLKTLLIYLCYKYLKKGE